MAKANLRSIENIETNDMNFKHLETTKDIVISPKNEYGDPQRPDTTHTWTAKVSDGENYVGDYKVKTNATSLIVDSKGFTKLPVGQYQLEVWEQWTDPDGTKQLSIYPSPSQAIHFQIYANITDQAGKEIKQIGFQDVVDQAVMNIGMNYVFKVNTIEPDQNATVVQSAADGKNYVTFNIPRGAKGDKGVQGNPGNDGHTPVKGTDYWTDADKQSIYGETKQYVEDTISKLGSFNDFGSLKSGADANDCTQTGMYSMGDNGTLKNVPVSYGVLMVIAPANGSTYITQLCISVIDAKSLYLRVKNGIFGWSGWNKFSGV